jgi:hypothetical protein
VRSPFLILLFALQFSSFASQAQATRPIPPGVRKAEQAEAQNERDTPSPTPHRTIDVGKLKHDADELAALAQSIPPDVDQTARGVLPKDLGAKLKRIEKLAKQLRSQLNP